MAIVCACVGSDLYVMLFGGFSLKETSCAISARCACGSCMFCLLQWE